MIKKLIVSLFFLSYFLVNAQDRVVFNYDDAGNQKKRYICLQCPVSKQVNDSSQVAEVDFIKSDVSDQISYYPNPVQEELYVTWTLVDDKKVESISVYNINGLLLTQFKTLNTNNLKTIPFSNYPSGVYIVSLLYNNGEQKDLKILKNK